MLWPASNSFLVLIIQYLTKDEQTTSANIVPVPSLAVFGALSKRLTFRKSYHDIVI